MKGLEVSVNNAEIVQEAPPSFYWNTKKSFWALHHCAVLCYWDNNYTHYINANRILWSGKYEFLLFTHLKSRVSFITRSIASDSMQILKSMIAVNQNGILIIAYLPFIVVLSESTYANPNGC